MEVLDMKKFYNSLHPFKFRLTVFGLLCGATMISLLLFRVRTLLSGSVEYAFLVWNIFLAWIPLGIAYTASTFSIKRRFIFLTIPFAVILWLIFFPNAPYILTDLGHLGVLKPGAPLWFDVLMLLWFAWTGLLIGLVSLFMMQGIVTRELGRVAGWGFVLVVGVLCSLGIYIGRFLRWNSWDLFLHPLERLADFLYYASHPSLQSIVFISVFAIFFLFIYITLYAFGLLFQEQARQGTQDVK
jgi:uncharacterized membrane protein